MILSWLILVFLLGGILAWLSQRIWVGAPRLVALLTTLVQLGLAISIGFCDPVDADSTWLMEQHLEWLPRWGIGYHLALDGMSYLLIWLTGIIGLISIGTAWREMGKQPGLFFACLLWALAGISGVFLAIDLFLFYVFWEVMLIPMVFLIGIWGYERRIYAATKFFIYTQFGSLLMLVAIIALVLIHGSQTGSYSFDLETLLQTQLGERAEFWLMVGFFIAFAIKLPIVPLHNWLPDAHGEAPTAGSVILAGLLLKTGAYGLIRFVLPLFPHASVQLAPIAVVLAAFGVLYGAKLAFAQTDIKRLVAYTSVSHMGFVLLALFAFTQLALKGAIMQMICHGLSTGALFVLAGMLIHRLHTRDITQMGGLWSRMPTMGAMALVFTMASLGLPGLGNFVAEFLILFGSFRAWPVATIVATIGIVVATMYSLRLFQKVFHGPETHTGIRDVSGREFVVMATLVLLIIWLGIYPQPVLDLCEEGLINWGLIGGGTP